MASRVRTNTSCGVRALSGRLPPHHSDCLAMPFRPVTVSGMHTLSLTRLDNEAEARGWSTWFSVHLLKAVDSKGVAYLGASPCFGSCLQVSGLETGRVLAQLSERYGP